MSAQRIWYELVPSTKKIYIITRKSYEEYYTFFAKKAFFTQLRRLAIWISYLGEKMLKLKIIM